MLGGSGTELLDMASLIAWSHHERFDGGGVSRAGTRASGSRWQAGRGGGGRVRRDHHRPRLTGRRRRSSTRCRSCATSAGASSTRPSVDAFLASLDDALEVLERFAPPPAEYPSPAPAPAGTRRSRSRRPPARSRSRRAGCGGGPTRGGSSRSAPPAGTAASRSRPSGGSPPSAASSRACGRSSRPRGRCRPWRSSSRGRDGRWRRPRRPRSTAKARRAGSRPRPPGRTCATG